MKRKYFIRPQAYHSSQLDEEIVSLHHAHTVFEPEPYTRDTGLLDQDGNSILVTETIDQIGFIRTSEES